jgi:hypothetical protein
MAYHFLLSLFSTPQEADAIEGDLIEEGATHAQHVRAIATLAFAPFRESPFMMIGVGILALAGSWPLAWLTMQAAQSLVVNVPVYDYVLATTFWQAVAFPPMVCVGLILSLVMGRRAMSAAIATFFAMAFIVCVIDPAVMLFLGPGRPQQVSMMFWISRAIYALAAWGGVVLLSTAIGISLRRKIRVAR